MIIFDLERMFVNDYSNVEAKPGEYNDYPGVNHDIEDANKPEVAKALKEQLLRPATPALRRNGELDVVHARGLYARQSYLSKSLSSANSASRSSSWILAKGMVPTMNGTTSCA